MTASVRSVLQSSIARLLTAASLAGLCTIAPLTAQAPKPPAQTPETAATLAKMTALRDDVISRLHALGFTCPLAVPGIVVEDVPSFGQYNVDSNVLSTTDWTLLSDRERALFFQISGPGATPAAVRNIFEQAAHGWIFVHEVGHWMQHCRGISADTRPPYTVEYGADRFSLAYWREADPRVVATVIPVFQGVLDHAPNPVPAGEEVEPYFNKNYDTLGPSPAYPWFQSRMNVTAYQEHPAPTLAQVLASVQ